MADKPITIALSDKLVDLDGGALKYDEKDLTVGRALALIVISEDRPVDPLRSYLLAKKLTDKKDEIELDVVEKKYLLDRVEKSVAFRALVLGQLLEKLQ